MAISYCERWVARSRNAVDPLPPPVAEQRHREGMPYTAIISERGTPRVIVELARDSIGVCFLDEHQRPYLQHDFQRHSLGRLFMTRAIHREYDGSSDRIVRGRMVLFTPEGKQVTILEDRVHGTSHEHEATVSVENNWNVYPDFAEYGMLCRIDRS